MGNELLVMRMPGRINGVPATYNMIIVFHVMTFYMSISYQVMFVNHCHMSKS